MTKEFAKKHSLSVILILFFLITFMSSLECLEVALHKSDYTKMTGTVTEKYSERYGSGRKRRTRHYISVSFEYEGETYHVRGLRANFWDKKGETVSFYMDSDGNIIRGTFILSANFISMFVMMIYCLIKVIMNGDPIFIQSSTPKGTVIDNYDSYPSQTTYNPTYNLGSNDTFMNNMSYQDAIPETSTNNGAKDMFSQNSATGSVPDESANNTDSHQQEQEASYHDIPVIDIPNDYL